MTSYGPRSPEMVARGNEAVARLRAGAEADRQLRMGPRDRAPDWIDPNPITAEMLRDVPDAPPRGAGMPSLRVPDAFRSLKERR